MTSLRSFLPATAKPRRRRRFARTIPLLAASISLLTACAGTGLAASSAPVVGQSAAATSAPAQSAPAAAASSNSTLPLPVNALADAGATTTILNPGVVSWVHFGDLHITTADQQNYQDFQTIIANTNQYLKNGVNFAVLPGDNANDDSESEYQLIKQATDQLQVPLYSVPGDHDEKTGLTFYNKYLEPNDYYSFSAGGHHFAFIDVMSGISDAERSWLTTDLDGAKAQGLKSVVFMHSMALAPQIQDLIQRDDVIMVDSGHTHYNDVANDGHTVYAAGRNTGQVTEGPVGFALVTLDNGVVSWKFKPLGSWPFVMITSPSDKQLMIDGTQVVHGTTDIRAKIWDDKGVASATMQVDGGSPVAMQRIGDTQMWSAPFDSTGVPDGDHQIKVNVQGAGGNTTEDTITVSVNQSGNALLPPRSFGPSGNDLGAYAEKGLLGSHVAGGGKGAPGGGRGGKNGPGGGLNAAQVVSVSGTQLTLKLPDGSQQTVQVGSGTQIVKESTGSVSDLQPGQTVDVKTQPAAGATTGATASTIAIHPASS